MLVNAGTSNQWRCVLPILKKRLLLFIYLNFTETFATIAGVLFPAYVITFVPNA